MTVSDRTRSRAQVVAIDSARGPVRTQPLLKSERLLLAVMVGVAMMVTGLAATGHLGLAGVAMVAAVLGTAAGWIGHRLLRLS